MADNLKRDSNTAVSFSSLIERTRTMIREVTPAGGFIYKDDLEEVLKRFEENMDREQKHLDDVRDLLFDPDIDNYGEKAAALFTEWDEGNKSVTCMTLALAAIEYFNIPRESPEAQAVFMAALLAEFPNSLQYHGNIHYRKVLFHTIRLIALHNQLFPEGERRLSPDEIGVLLVASCIHDLGHEGGDNLRDGVYTPGYMEQKALEISRPYLEQTGLDEEKLADIDTMVFSTDITLFAGDNSPCVRMKKIYKSVFWDSGEDVSLMMMGRMRRYSENPKLVHMAMILHEADIGSSAGLSYEQTIEETKNIMEERGLKTAGPKTVLAFLREQLGQTMFTEAGKQLFGPVMEEVINRAEKENLAGRETFYETI